MYQNDEQYQITSAMFYGRENCRKLSFNFYLIKHLVQLIYFIHLFNIYFNKVKLYKEVAECNAVYHNSFYTYTLNEQIDLPALMFPEASMNSNFMNTTFLEA
jgi:hypothetical protein